MGLISTILELFLYLLFIVLAVKFFRVLDIRKKVRKEIMSIILACPDARKILENLIIGSARQEIKEKTYIGHNSDEKKAQDIVEVGPNLRDKLSTFSQDEVREYFLENVMSEKVSTTKSRALLYNMKFQDRKFEYMGKIGLAKELNDPLAFIKIAGQYKIYEDNFRKTVTFSFLASALAFLLLLANCLL